MRYVVTLLLFICLFAFPAKSFGNDIESRIRKMEETLKTQQKTIEEQQKIINELKEQIKTVRTEEIPKIAEKAAMPKEQAGATGLFGGSALTNPYISLVLNTYAYGSDVKESELKTRGIPGYTFLGNGEKKKGFNLESAELFLFAPVDPFFNAYATIPVKEDGAELEEAYFVTTCLPRGFQVKGGKFKSGFGRINGQHPHVWDFVDSPLIYRVFTGDEGLIEKGVQFTYLPGLPFYTILGIEILQGDNKYLFGADATPGPHAYTAFAKSSFDASDYSTFLFGLSMATGKTRTNTITSEDNQFRGNSTLYGAELTYKWKPSKKKSFILQSEYFQRRQGGDLYDTALATINRLTRQQDGMYIQGLYQWEQWRFGARYDVLDLFKSDFVLAGSRMDFGRRPWRATGSLEFNPSEFSRIRLQYNYDKSARNIFNPASPSTNNEVFLQFIFGIGAHAAHPF